jgi:outer membrane biosynthesis protein TonB
MKKSVSVLFVCTFLVLVSCKKNTESGVDETPTSTVEESKMKEVYVNENGFSNGQTNEKSSTPTVMTFDSVTHDFGDIKQGSKVDHEFTFKNTGTNDLIITDAKGSCGCTVPEYPKEAVKPGESGKIKVSFNSDGKSGNQSKTVTIFANTANGTEMLTIKSNVIK